MKRKKCGKSAMDRTVYPTVPAGMMSSSPANTAAHEEETAVI
jgi:hypothetical protein